MLLSKHPISVSNKILELLMKPIFNQLVLSGIIPMQTRISNGTFFITPESNKFPVTAIKFDSHDTTYQITHVTVETMPRLTEESRFSETYDMSAHLGERPTVNVVIDKSDNSVMDVLFEDINEDKLANLMKEIYTTLLAVRALSDN